MRCEFWDEGCGNVLYDLATREVRVDSGYGDEAIISNIAQYWVRAVG